MKQFKVLVVLVLSLVSWSAWSQVENGGGQLTTTLRGRSPWSSSFFQYARANRELVAEGDARLETYNYIGINYQLNPDQRISLRPAFLYNTGGLNSFGDQFGQEFILSDVHINLSQYNVDNFLGMKPVINFKMYLPTSSSSKEATLITRLGGHFILEKNIEDSKVKVAYNIKPDYYFVEDPTYTKTIKTNPVGRPGRTLKRLTQNKQAGIDQYVEVGYTMNRDLAFKGMVGFKDEWLYGDRSKGRAPTRNESFKWGPSVEYRINRDVSIIGGMENSWSVLRPNPNRTQGILRGSETDYFVLTSARL